MLVGQNKLYDTLTSDAAQQAGQSQALSTLFLFYPPKKKKEIEKKQKKKREEDYKAKKRKRKRRGKRIVLTACQSLCKPLPHCSVHSTRHTFSFYLPLYPSPSPPLPCSLSTAYHLGEDGHRWSRGSRTSCFTVGHCSARCHVGVSVIMD